MSAISADELAEGKDLEARILRILLRDVGYDNLFSLNGAYGDHYHKHLPTAMAEIKAEEEKSMQLSQASLSEYSNKVNELNANIQAKESFVQQEKARVEELKKKYQDDKAAYDASKESLTKQINDLTSQLQTLTQKHKIQISQIPARLNVLEQSLTQDRALIDDLNLKLSSMSEEVSDSDDQPVYVTSLTAISGKDDYFKILERCEHIAAGAYEDKRSAEYRTLTDWAYYELRSRNGADVSFSTRRLTRYDHDEEFQKVKSRIAKVINHYFETKDARARLESYYIAVQERITANERLVAELREANQKSQQLDGLQQQLNALVPPPPVNNAELWRPIDQARTDIKNLKNQKPTVQKQADFYNDEVKKSLDIIYEIEGRLFRESHDQNYYKQRLAERRAKYLATNLDKYKELVD